MDSMIAIPLLPSGAYVVAVSGGVDSMVLLHLLTQQRQEQDDKSLRLIAAHFDHGMRNDSHQDSVLVREFAARHRIPVVIDRVKLGADASEDKARRARYKFLYSVMQASSARVIITAHHADDELETAVINMFRGTGRRGLSSLRSDSHADVLRPLLSYTKADIYHYARRHNVPWREDDTNHDTRYIRNHIRHVVLGSASERDKRQLRRHIDHAHAINQQIDGFLAKMLHLQPGKNKLRLHVIRAYPHEIRRELMAAWLRKNNVRDFSRSTIERLVHACCTAVQQTKHEVVKGYYIKILPEVALLEKT